MNNYNIPKSPFRESKKNPKVFIANGNGPYQNTINALKSIDLSPAKGKKVLLKPNIGRMATAESGVITHPEVIAAAIDIFTQAGAKVSIGESPITGVKTPAAYQKSGVTEIANNRNCPLIDMDKRPYIPIALPNGIAIKELKVCPDIFDFDILVSLPVMKMHMHTGVTLSIKNMKGCLWRRSKVKLHMLPKVKENTEKPLNIAIADMTDFIRPHLSIIDGNYCMEGLGPSAGEIKKMDLVIAAINPFAADAVACKLMGTDANNIPHLKLCQNIGFDLSDSSQIDISPANWKSLIKPFAKPPENIAVNFENVKVLDNNSCSACQSTLLLFLKKHGKNIFDYFPKDKDINIAIGKGHEVLPENTLCIGNCTFANKNVGTFVKGCPPVGSEILKAISGKTTTYEDL